MFIDNTAVTEEHLSRDFPVSFKRRKKSFSKIWWGARATRAEDSQGIPNVRILLVLRGLLLEILLPFSIFSSIFGERLRIRSEKSEHLVCRLGCKLLALFKADYRQVLSCHKHISCLALCVVLSPAKIRRKKDWGPTYFEKNLLLLRWKEETQMSHIDCENRNGRILTVKVTSNSS